MQTRLPGIMSISVALVRKLDTVAPELRDVLLELVDEIEQHREASVTKVEFNELKEIVRDLAQAQTLTGQRMEELAQAQARTEQRMDSLAVRMEELAQAQTRTEQRMEELAQAQTRTEQRMDSLAVRMEELAQAQARTEQRMEELAQAQARTEAEVAKLAVSHGHLRSQVGGLAQTMAYALENDALGSPLNRRSLNPRFSRGRSPEGAPGSAGVPVPAAAACGTARGCLPAMRSG